MIIVSHPCLRSLSYVEAKRRTSVVVTLEDEVRTSCVDWNRFLTYICIYRSNISGFVCRSLDRTSLYLLPFDQPQKRSVGKFMFLWVCFSQHHRKSVLISRFRSDTTQLSCLYSTLPKFTSSLSRASQMIRCEFCSCWTSKDDADSGAFKRCVAMDSVIRIVGAISLWSVEIIMQLRVYALYKCSKRVSHDRSLVVATDTLTKNRFFTGSHNQRSTVLRFHRGLHMDLGSQCRSPQSCHCGGNSFTFTRLSINSFRHRVGPMGSGWVSLAITQCEITLRRGSHGLWGHPSWICTLQDGEVHRKSNENRRPHLLILPSSPRQSFLLLCVRHFSYLLRDH